MHYAKQVYANNQSPEDKDYLKWHGSYLHYPLIPQPISISHRQILKTQVLPSTDSHKSDGGSNGVMKFFNLKDTTQHVRMLYRKHLRIDIKNYLKRKFGKPFHMIPSEGFQCVRLVSDDSQLFKTNVFYLYQPYYLMKNIRITLFKNAQLLTKPIIHGLFYELLNLSLQFRGLDNFLMTTSNVYLSDDLQNLYLNYNSFVGLSFLKLPDNEQVQIGRNQFLEIYPYLDSKVLNRIPKDPINYTLKIRCFVINCLALILGQDIEFLTEKFTSTDVERKKKQVREKIQNIRKEYEDLLKKNPYKKRINNYTKKFGIDFQKLFDEVLIKEQDLSWSSVVTYFISQEEKDEDNQEVNKAFIELHEEIWADADQKERQQYKEKRMDHVSLYLPIKFGACLQQVLKHKYWWNVFIKKYSQVHESFSFKIMNYIAEKLKKQIEQKKQEITSYSIEEYSKAGKIIMNCWREKWKERASSGHLGLYQFHDKWKELFGQ